MDFGISIRARPSQMDSILINKISLTIIMFNNKITYNKPYPFQQSITLTKLKGSYDKLEKEMQKPPSDYEGIKQLIENHNNSITNLQNNINIKSNKNISIQNHGSALRMDTVHRHKKNIKNQK